MPTDTTKDRPTGRQVGREKLEIPTESSKFSTPPSNLKPFSLSPRPREIPPLPKNSVYLIKKYLSLHYVTRDSKHDSLWFKFRF